MPNETPTVVPFHYIKANLFRVVHTDGIIGSVTPNGLIFLGLYSERAAIPQVMVHEISGTGQVGPEHPDERVGKKGVVREIEVGAVMSIETAGSVIAWLQDKVDLMKKMKATDSRKASSNAPAVQ